MGDPLQLVEVVDWSVLLTVADDQFCQIAVNIRVGDQLLISGDVYVQLSDFLLVDIQIIL